MTSRGEATRERLLDATRRVVREVGYTHATTRTIAREAGVTEGTIYRHFPDKRALFFAAVLDGNASMLGELANLPARAGHDTVEDNLIWALHRLSTLRDEVLPLELALLTDPQAEGPPILPLPGEGTTAGTAIPGPPAAITAYLAAEQRLGRMRPEIDPDHATVVLLTLLFGLSLRPHPDGTGADALAAGVRVIVLGIGTAPAPTRHSPDSTRHDNPPTT